jgi:hypothetical protein
MNRPIGYKVPTFFDSASEAKAEWMRWVAYVNKLEEDKARLLKALKRLHRDGSIVDDYDAEIIITEMEGEK